MKYNNAFSLFVVVCAMHFVWSCGGDRSVDPSSADANDELLLLNGAIEKNPESASAYHRRGEYYRNKKFYPDAIRDFISCTEKDSSHKECWRLLAESYLEDNRSRLAIETLEDYLKLFPNDLDMRLQMSNYQTIIERYNAAHFNLNEILKKDPTHAEALLLKGLIYRYQDKDIEAVEYLQQAIQSNPDLTDGHLLLGQLFEEAGNPLAKKYYENAIRVDPDNREAQLGLANYTWSLGDKLGALRLYEALIERHPMFHRAIFNKGLLYMEMDSMQAAESTFENVISIQGDFVPALYYLAEVYAHVNRWEEAKSKLETALKLEPANEKVQEKLKEVNYLMSK